MLAAVVFVFLIYRRPKLMFSFLILILILVGTYYVIMSMSFSAKIEKQRLIHKSEESATIER